MRWPIQGLAKALALGQLPTLFGCCPTRSCFVFNAIYGTGYLTARMNNAGIGPFQKQSQGPPPMEFLLPIITHLDSARLDVLVVGVG